jgi:hypothetical protein
MICIGMDPRGMVVTKVDAIVEAHEEGIGVSGALVRICPFG